MENLPFDTGVVNKVMGFIPGNQNNQENENEELSFEEKLKELSDEIEEEETQQHIDMIMESDEEIKNQILDLNPNSKHKPIIDVESHVYQDLDIWNNNSVLSVIDNTITFSGQKVLKWHLETPSNEQCHLENRKKNIKALLNKIKANPTLLSQIREELYLFKTRESSIGWFWREDEEMLNSMLEMVYFGSKFFLFLNRQTIILQLLNMYKIVLTPLMALMYPVISLLVPLIAFKMMGFSCSLATLWQFIKLLIKNKFYNTQTGKISIFSIGLWIFMYFQGIQSAVSNAKNTNRVIDLIHNRLNNMAYLVERTKRLHPMVFSDNDNGNDSGSDNIRHLYSNQSIDNINDLSLMFEPTVFHTEPKIIENKGLILSTFTDFNQKKNQISKMLGIIGEIDFISSIATLLIEKSNFFAFVDYAPITKYQRKQPILYLENGYHPNLIEKKNLTGNTVYLGKDAVVESTNSIVTNSNQNKNNENENNENQKIEQYRNSWGNNMMITGVNASGKSIFIKTLAINVLLAQTLGIACASRMILTPFTVINTYLHIPDDKGRESLFEAEMHRSYNHIKQIQSISPYDFSFVIMDEIFSSTNYEEGYSAAHAISLKLAKIPNSISVITTHYSDLISVQKATQKAFRNYMFKVYRRKSKNENGNENKNKDDIYYDYKLRRGGSRQTIALELLERNGFDKEIIRDAVQLKNKLISLKRKRSRI